MPTSITLPWNSAFSICTKCSEFLKLQSFRLHCQSRGACFAALKQCALSVHTWSGTFLLPPCPSQLWPCPQLEDAASPAIAIACARFAGTAGILGRCRTSPHSPSRVSALLTHTHSPAFPSITWECLEGRGNVVGSYRSAFIFYQGEDPVWLETTFEIHYSVMYSSLIKVGIRKECSKVIFSKSACR